jgi:adenine-specific DNA-methyltransferase
MSDEAERVDLDTPDLAAEKRAAFEGLLPGVLDDGVLDASRLGELLDAPITAPADGRERFGLMWAGKQDAVRSLLEPGHGTLVPDFEKSLDFDDAPNTLIEGENLEVLKLLQKAYNDRIKLIYIDPPYNTGSDFVYSDDFRQGFRAYLEETGQIDASGDRTAAAVETDGRRHSNWLSMMYPRLVLARNVLAQDGAIFVSIDDNEAANLRLLLDEVFGSENFIAQIIRNTNSSKNQSRFVSVSHDYCLVYARSISALSERYASEKWAVPKNNVEEYKKRVVRMQRDGMSPEEITEQLKTLTNYPRFIDFTNYWYFDDRGLYRKDNLGGVRNGNMEPLVNPLTGREDPIPPGGFRFNAERLAELVGEGRIHFATDGSLPTIKRYLEENDTQRPKSIMSDDQRPDAKLLERYGIPFDNPKQLAFLTRLVAISDPDAVVLDFFAGSGTTAHAVLEQNAEDGGTRRFILVQYPELVREGGFDSIADMTYSRVTQAMADSEVSGLRVFRLQQSHFHRESVEEKTGLFDLSDTTLSAGADAFDAVAAEILLKEGVSLDSVWTRTEAGGAPVISADGVAIVLSLELTDQIVEAALEIGSRVVVFLEDGFAGADAVKANAVTNARNREITLKTV